MSLSPQHSKSVLSRIGACRPSPRICDWFSRGLYRRSNPKVVRCIISKHTAFLWPLQRVLTWQANIDACERMPPTNVRSFLNQTPPRISTKLAPHTVACSLQVRCDKRQSRVQWRVIGIRTAIGAPYIPTRSEGRRYICYGTPAIDTVEKQLWVVDFYGSRRTSTVSEERRKQRHSKIFTLLNWWNEDDVISVSEGAPSPSSDHKHYSASI